MAGTVKWWQKPQRMLRHDYLSDFSEWNHYDLREVAREKRRVWRVSLEWIHGTPGSWPGNAQLVTFDSERFEKVAGLEIDLPRAYVKAAHAEGLRVVAYVNCHWYGRDFAAKHPDWEQRLSDGRGYGEYRALYGSGTTLCPNSPWRAWFLALIDELMDCGLDGIFLDGPAVYPRCCYCEHCQQRFRAEYGAELPEWEDWENPLWKKFIAFRIASTGRFLTDVVDRVHRRNPDAVCFMNSGGWRSGEWRVGRSVDVLADLQDISGAEAFFHPDLPEETAWDGYVMGKVQAATGKPSVVFFHHAFGGWHYEPLPPGEAIASAVQAAATGSSVWFGVFHPAVRMNRDRTVRPVARSFELAERIHELVAETESAARVGVLLSKTTASFYLSQVQALYHDPGSGAEIGLMVEEGGRTILWGERKRYLEDLADREFFGTCLALGNQHVPFDIVHESNLRLERYDAILLPNAACLSEGLVHSVLDWVREGGTLVLSLESGRYNQDGCLRSVWELGQAAGITDVIGGWLPRTAEEYVVIAEDAPAPLGAGQLLPRPPYGLKVKVGADVSVLAWFMNEIGYRYRLPQGRSDFPAITVREYGRGKLLYVACLLGAAIKTYRLPAHESLLAGALRVACPQATFVETNAPRGTWLDVRRRRSGESLLLQFLNRVASPERPSRELAPAGPFEVKLRGVRVRQAQAILAGRGLPFSNHDWGCSILVETMPPGEWVELMLA